MKLSLQSNRYRILFVFIFVLFIILAFFSARSISVFLSPLLAKKTEVSFLDVGQGDAMLIESKYGQEILIDGGANDSVLQRLDEEMPWFDREIDLIILTHPHEDHIVGQIGVLRERFVKKAVYTGVNFPSSAYEAWKREIAGRGVELLLADRKRKIILGDDSYLEMIYPDKSLADEKMKNVNNSSIVVRFVEGDASFLFVGDIEKEVENKLLAEEADLAADVLKIGHQGSDTSSSEEFLAKVKPKHAVIEVGENKFGHPSPRVLNRLTRAGINIHRTDLSGTISFVIDNDIGLK